MPQMMLKEKDATKESKMIIDSKLKYNEQLRVVGSKHLREIAVHDSNSNH